MISDNHSEEITKKNGLWSRLQLRGRLLIIMLIVAASVLLICAASFIVMNNRMLKSTRDDATNLAETVHDEFEIALYQQEMYLRMTYASSQAGFVDRRLEEIYAKGETPDWNELAKEAYDIVNNWNLAPWGVLADMGTIQFIMYNGEYYAYESYIDAFDTENFINTMDSFYFRNKDTGFYNNPWETDVQQYPVHGAYDRSEDGLIVAWCSIDGGAGRVGLLQTGTNEMPMSEGLRGLIDDQTKIAVENISKASWQSLLGFIIIIGFLLLILPLASRRLALVVVNPVEREQERQRDLLRAAEEEKAMLERLDRLKTEFLGNISHELKTPLTIVTGYALNSEQQLRSAEGVADNAELAANMKLISSEAERLALMVSQILDLTRIEEGRMMIVKKPCHADEIIHTSIETYYPVLNKNENKLEIHIAECLPQINADPVRVSQVIVNLVANAIRFTNRGLISLSATAKGRFVEISVADSGRGISPEKLPHIFDRYNNQKSDDSNDSGTGLGLFICKHIVEEHGGEIVVESEPGKGTTVKFTIPAVDLPLL